jgi:ribosomal protein S18 acetylase RimI-like enzyme
MTLTETASGLLQIHHPSLGHAALHRLDWDTEFFGTTFGMIDAVEPVSGVADRQGAYASLLGELSVAASAAGYAHLTYRPPGEDWQAVHGAERAGFLLIDVGVDFCQRLTETPPPIAAAIRRSRDEDLAALRDLAATAFVHSRFAVDPYFSEQQVQDFHRQWVTNLHNGLAQRVLVSELDGTISGFASCALSGEQGRIPLIAVNSAFRSRGLGKELVQAALRWLYEADAKEVRVKTQAANTRATSLYERCGFALERSELTFSRVLP